MRLLLFLLTIQLVEKWQWKLISSLHFFSSTEYLHKYHLHTIHRKRPISTLVREAVAS